MTLAVTPHLELLACHLCASKPLEDIGRSVHKMARTNGNKRKAQSGGPGKGRYLSKSSKKQKKSNDLYEASDSDPDEEKHAERYDVSKSSNGDCEHVL